MLRKAVPANPSRHRRLRSKCLLLVNLPLLNFSHPRISVQWRSGLGTYPLRKLVLIAVLTTDCSSDDELSTQVEIASPSLDRLNLVRFGFLTSKTGLRTKTNRGPGTFRFPITFAVASSPYAQWLRRQ
jgi:hypothetical protein